MVECLENKNCGRGCGMDWKVSTRAQHFKTGIFAKLGNYKFQKIKEGKHMIDLSVGSPDKSPPDFVMKALSQSVLESNRYGYTLKGIQEFNDAVADYYLNRFDVSVDAKSEVLQVTGSQDGIVHLPMLYAQKGDMILVPDPGYTAYETGVSLSEATLYPMPLLEENQFLPDLKAIPEHVAQQAKIMILNFPGNPVPALATEAFFKEAIAFARKHHILIIHDFAYCELYYDNVKPISFLSVEGAREVGVEFNSLSKSFNMAGCRIGYLIGNKSVIETLSQFKSNVDYGIFEPIQRAAILALRQGDQFTAESRILYEKRRNLLVNGLRELGWIVTSPPASMFIWAKIPKGYSSLEFTYALMDEAGIVVTPGNAFGEHGEGYVRIALVHSEKVLTDVVRRLQNCSLFKNTIQQSV